MPYANVDDRLWVHPKTHQVGLAGTGLFVKALSYCACYGTDGFVDESWVRLEVERPGEDATLPDKLTEAGLWRKVKDGYRIPDFLEHNISKVQWDARKAAGKKAAEARWRNAERIAEPEPEPDPEPDCGHTANAGEGTV